MLNKVIKQLFGFLLTNKTLTKSNVKKILRFVLVIFCGGVSSMAYANLTDQKVIILKSKIRKPTCFVDVPANIDLGEVQLASPAENKSVEYFNNFNELEINIHCEEGRSAESWVQLSSSGVPGEVVTGGGAKFVSMVSSETTDNSFLLQLGLAYLESDNTKEGVFDQNLNSWLAIINAGTTTNTKAKYCFGYPTRTCRFKPVIVAGQKDTLRGKGSFFRAASNSYEQSVTFTLTYP